MPWVLAGIVTALGAYFLYKTQGTAPTAGATYTPPQLPPAPAPPQWSVDPSTGFGGLGGGYIGGGGGFFPPSTDPSATEADQILQVVDDLEVNLQIDLGSPAGMALETLRSNPTVDQIPGVIALVEFSYDSQSIPIVDALQQLQDNLAAEGIVAAAGG